MIGVDGRDSSKVVIADGSFAGLETMPALRTLAGAREAGVPVEATPLEPVLRALLLPGDRPVFLRAALGGRHGDPGVGDWEPLWWPPAKVGGLYLAPFLAENLEVADGGQS